MMKLKFEVQHRPHSDTRVALKPLDCGLHGLAVYDNLPKRALELLPGGAIVEATIQLPDQYPINEDHKGGYETPLGRVVIGAHYVDKGHPLVGEPQYDYWEVRCTGAALPLATFLEAPLLPLARTRAIDYAYELEAMRNKAGA